MAKAKQTASTHPSNSALGRRAMLANLSIGLWDGRKRDDKVTSEVTSESHAERDAGAWWTRTVPAKALTRIVAVADQGRKAHWQYTLPWQDNGQRILPAQAFLDYSSRMRELKAQFYIELDRFLKEYPEILAKAKDRLGDLYRPEWYPTVKDLQRRFYWESNFSPLPEVADFRVDLPEEDLKEIKATYERQFEDSFKGAMSDAWKRLHEAISKIADRLADSKAILRSTMFEPLVELATLLPKLNVTEDPNLDKLSKEVIEKFKGKDPEALRKSKVERADATKQASDILKKMAEFMPPPPAN